jgi:hypothetical protein
LTRDGARSLLAAAGWIEGRKASIEPDLAVLAEEGYPTWESLRGFLEEFSGLDVRVPRHGTTDSIWFASSKAARLVDKRWVEEYADRIGCRVVPVGAARQDHLLVLLAEDGRLFGGFDDELGELGDDVVEAVETLAWTDQFKRRL